MKNNQKKHTYKKAPVKRFERHEKKVGPGHEFKRGEMYWIDMKGDDGNLYKIRPAIIISNDKSNHCSDMLTVIPLTTWDADSARSAHLPVHVNLIGADDKKSVAKCEHIAAVNKSQVYSYIRTLKDKEIRDVTFAALIQIGVM